MKMFKSTAVACGGVLLAMLVVSLVQQLGHALFEVPAGLEGATLRRGNAEIIEAWIPTAPFDAIAMVLLSWVSGTYFGCVVCRLALPTSYLMPMQRQQSA